MTEQCVEPNLAEDEVIDTTTLLLPELGEENTYHEGASGKGQRAPSLMVDEERTEN